MQQLMQLGWYRAGHVRTTTAIHWRFRHGHTLNATLPERWVAAADETEATHRLWTALRTERRAEKV